MEDGFSSYYDVAKTGIGKPFPHCDVTKSSNEQKRKGYFNKRTKPRIPINTNEELSLGNKSKLQMSLEVVVLQMIKYP